MIAFDHVYPVFGYDLQDEQIVPRKIYGTAQSIGGGYLLTAEHVAAAAHEHNYIAVGRWEKASASYSIHWVEGYDGIGHDAAVLDVELPKPQPLSWSTGVPDRLSAIFTAGYPYGFDVSGRTITMRAFQGYVVAHSKAMELPHTPEALELSFQCPRGLSGAPLIRNGTNAVVGVINGNSTTEMLVFSDREVLTEDKESTVERYEAVHFGVAITAAPLLELQSEMLGGSLGGHLENNGLLT